MPSLKI